MYSTGKYSHQFVITLNGDGEGQRSWCVVNSWHRKELDTTEQLNNKFKWSIICKNIESLCCIPETNTVLLINHTLIEKKKKGKAEKCFLPGPDPTYLPRTQLHALPVWGWGHWGSPPCSTHAHNVCSLCTYHPVLGLLLKMPASCIPHCPGHWEGSGFGVMSQKGAQPWRGSVNML